MPHKEHAASRRTTQKPAKRAGTHTAGAEIAHPSPLIAEAERIVWEVLGTPRAARPRHPLLLFLLGVGSALAVCLPFLIDTL